MSRDYVQAAQALADGALERKADPAAASLLESSRSFALVAIATELRRANDARDDFYREVVDTLKALREEEDPQGPGVDQASGSDDAEVRR